MSKRLAIFFCLSAAVGTAILYWCTQPAPVASRQSAPSVQADPAEDVTPNTGPALQAAQQETEALKQRISELDRENEKIRGQLTDLLNWILANVRGRYPIREQDLSHLRLPAVDEDFQVHAGLADFLKLSTDETFLVEDAFEFTRAQLRVLQDANMELIQDTPNQIVMNIHSFPEAGLSLQHELDLALEASMGSDKLERFRTVSRDTLREAFDYFGQASRTLIFELRDDATTGLPTLIINDGWFDEQNPEQLVYTESEIAVETLPEKYRDFEIYLTESFAPVTHP